MSANSPRPMKSWLLSGAIVLALGITTLLLCLRTPEPNAAPKAGVVLNLPDTVNSLEGESQDVTEDEKIGLPPDTQFAKKVYKDDENDQIVCQIVLSGNDKRSIHRPEACLRGQGWTIENGGTVPITLADGSDLKVMQLVIDRPIEVGGKPRTIRSLYLYWFVSKEGTTPYHWERIAKTNFDLLFHNQTHRWAYIIVSAPVLEGFVANGKNEKQTLEMLKNFVSEAAPKFQRVGEGVDIPPKT